MREDIELSDRAILINDKIAEILDNTKPNDPDYCDKLRVAKELYAELNNELKMAYNAVHDDEELAFESSKFEQESAMKVEDREFKQMELTQQADIAEKQRKIKIVEIAAGLATFVVGSVISVWMFGRSSRKEHGDDGYPETYDTLTDRTVIQNGLKQKPFKLPW